MMLFEGICSPLIYQQGIYIFFLLRKFSPLLHLTLGVFEGHAILTQAHVDGKYKMKGFSVGGRRKLELE